MIVLGLGAWGKRCIWISECDFWNGESKLCTKGELLAYLGLYVWYGSLSYACLSSSSPFAFALMA